ncbi:hypothetical protein [Achromobacter aegrifaciens]|uniref:Uncharacterized protein n=1 Tax=Achromobacter aegrifaciens TaxID=1287736 RepID=A0ABU2DJM4_ACHAE|nr:hypothetical protein [Achromobacter aegrifaciens]MDR7948283.1 hypothetical protein [Achromobacter aegrifaciens]
MNGFFYNLLLMCFSLVVLVTIIWTCFLTGRKENRCEPAAVPDEPLSERSPLELAGAVHERVNALLYQEIISALEQALHAHGIQFSDRSAENVALALPITRDVADRVMRARMHYLCPFLDAEELQKAVENGRADGFSQVLVHDLIAALAAEGRFLSQVNSSVERSDSSGEPVDDDSSSSRPAPAPPTTP